MMRKPALAGAAVLLLLLNLLANLLALAASLYGHYAERRLDNLPDERATRASAYAATLAPWSAPRLALHGWMLGTSGDFAGADAAYLKALKLAPADPLLWAEYALVLARNRVFDERLTLATTRALALAPASPAVRQGVARMALSYWRFGSPEVRELWRQSLRWELDHNRAVFLQALERDGHRRAFCANHAADLGEQEWCRRA